MSDTLKKCSKCEEVKPLTSFHKHSKSSDGRRPDCIECCKIYRIDKAIKDPIAHKIRLMASGVLKRTKYDINKLKNKAYKKNMVQNKLGDTLPEIVATLNSHFYNDIINLLERGENPSIDRIDPKGDYEIGNIRIIDLKENVKMGVENAKKVNSRKIKTINDFGEEKVFNSITDVAKYYSVKRDTVYYHLNKGTKTSKGLMFNSI